MDGNETQVEVPAKDFTQGCPPGALMDSFLPELFGREEVYNGVQ